MSGRKEFRRVVVGLDGSANSRRAAAFMARLKPPRRGHVTCVRVVEPVRVPSMPLLLGAMRAQIAGQVDAMNRIRRATAQRQVEAAAATLDVRAGAPPASSAPVCPSPASWPPSGRLGPTSSWWARGARAR
jgi:hypothetical protein